MRLAQLPPTYVFLFLLISGQGRLSLGMASLRMVRLLLGRMSRVLLSVASVLATS